jgi:O-antigen/teichoic acid export membrane protein
MNILHLLKKDILKDLSFLMGGTFIAQLIPILLQPLLKRLFTVEEFGIFDIYFRSVGILAVIYSLKYEGAIVISKEKRDSVSIYTGIIILGFSFFILTELILLVLNSFDISLIRIPEKHSLIIYLIPLSAFFFTINTASQFMFIRHKRFLASSSLKIYRRGTEGLIQTGSGFTGKFWGLPLGELLGNITAALVGFIRLRKEVKKYLPESYFSTLLTNAKKYSDFPKYAFASNLLNTFILSALTFQIFAKFSLEEVGYAELTQRMLTVPTALIGVSLGQVILQRFSEAYIKGASVKKLFAGLLAFVLLIAIPFFITIYFWGPEIFGWVFGEEWQASGMYARQLIVSTCFFFVISPFGQVLIAFQKVKLNSMWQYLKFLVVGSFFFINFQSIENYLKYYNLSLIVLYAIYLVIISMNVANYQKVTNENNH